MKRNNILQLVILLVAIGYIAVDRFYVSRQEARFIHLEKERIKASNRLATARIVAEKQQHVEDLITKNMDVGGRSSKNEREENFFVFLTECINDLKLKLVSVYPILPEKEGRITKYPYELEIEGDFFKFGELCAKFENSRRIISIDHFEVENTRTPDAKMPGKEKNTVKIFMRVGTYWIEKGTENK